MSSVFGIWHLDDSVVNENWISKMKDILTQYGRDAQDIYVDKNIALGSCLNKISVCSKNDSPIHVEQEIILAADAQIYNRDELIYDYGLTKKADISNNELILEAYKKWGEKCPQYINGDFAFVIWEKGKDRMVIVRDHLGIRPLYYYHSNAVFVFATDYRAILALPFIPKKVHEKMLYKLLEGHVLGETENTLLAGIKKLPQAHLLKVEKKAIATYKYWTPGLGKKIIYDTEQEYFQALFDVVFNAIKLRIDYINEKIGAQMSGGLDSAVINILANRELKKNDKKLLLFSWAPSFDSLARLPRDERKFIEDICKQEDLECLYYDYEKDLDSKELDEEKMVKAGGLSPLMQEMQIMSSRGIRLILSGWGGDQGISHRANLFELFINGYWSYFIREAFLLSKGSFLKLVKIIISNTIFKFFGPFSYLGKNREYGINIATKDFDKSMEKHRKRKILYFNIDPVKHLESGNIQTRTEISACLGSEYNIQYIFPFLDYKVVDFAMSIPRHMFYKNGINRYAYRKAFAKLLPQELCYYTPKDDIARLTYYFEKIKNEDIVKKILEQKLDREMFAKYLDFNKAKELINEEDRQIKNIIKRKIYMCYNIQNIINKAKKNLE